MEFNLETIIGHKIILNKKYLSYCFERWGINFMNEWIFLKTKTFRNYSLSKYILECILPNIRSPPTIIGVKKIKV